MTGFWLVSYLVLWVIVLVLCFFLVGVLRQLGLLSRHLEQRPSQSSSEEEDAIPALEQDGPMIGSALPPLGVDTCNGFGNVTPDVLREQGCHPAGVPVSHV